MTAGFKYENDDETKDDDNEQEDALSPTGVLLVSVAFRQSAPCGSPDEESGTDLVATVSSRAASATCTDVCSMLYSTESRSVPWSITSAERSLNRSPSWEIEFAISLSSWLRRRTSGGKACCSVTWLCVWSTGQNTSKTAW
jgi:hypothetical protein